MHKNKNQLEVWKEQINDFLTKELRLHLHPDKSKGIDFVGFRNFYYFKLLRKRNIRNMERKIEMFIQGLISKEKIEESFQGW